jgi:hypothetical protein
VRNESSTRSAQWEVTAIRDQREYAGQHSRKCPFRKLSKAT